MFIPLIDTRIVSIPIIFSVVQLPSFFKEELITDLEYRDRNANIFPPFCFELKFFEIFNVMISRKTRVLFTFVFLFLFFFIHNF